MVGITNHTHFELWKHNQDMTKIKHNHYLENHILTKTFKSKNKSYIFKMTNGGDNKS